MKQFIIIALFLYGIITTGASTIVYLMIYEEKRKLKIHDKDILYLYFITGISAIILSILIFIL